MTSPDDVPTQPALPLPEGAARGMSPAFEAAMQNLAKDYLRDRRSDRRWKIFFRLLWIVVFLAFVSAIVNSQRKTVAASTPHTALIEIRGEIAQDSEASAENIVAGLKSAFGDEGAQAIVLRINSPGGSPVQAGIVNDEIKRLRKLNGKKKVYAVCEEVCASGAYYIAAAADEIFVDKASIVGSIGVLMDGFGFTGTMEKLGVERRLLTAGENKGIGDPFSPMSARQKQFTLDMLEQIHRQFIAVVREGRGKKLKENSEMFSGLFWNGEEALRMGLADRLGNLDYVARDIVKAEEVIDYTPKDNVAERLAKKFGASVGAGAVRALQSSTLTLH